MFDVLKLQQQLVAAAAPSGNEKKMGQLLADLARPFVDEIRTDAMGNVICRKKGRGKRVMAAAHMDVIGFLATFVDEKGFVWFDHIGGHNPSYLINTRVVFANGTRGVIRPKALDKLAEKKMSAVRFSDLYIDIGAKDQAEAKKLIKIGDTAIFEGAPRMILGNNVMGPYADDLIGCVVLLMAMEQLQETKNDLYFVFSVQEEIGCRGAKTAAFGVEPHLGIACDVCPVGDTPADDGVHMAVCVGKGPTIKIKDSSVYCSPEANAHVRAAAKKAGVIYQDEILTGGGTDTSEMQMARDGAMATCISIPTRNIHLPVEIFNIDDVQGAAKLLAAAMCAKL